MSAFKPLRLLGLHKRQSTPSRIVLFRCLSCMSCIRVCKKMGIRKVMGLSSAPHHSNVEMIWVGFFFPKPMVRTDWGKHNPHYTLCPMWGLVASLCCYKCHCWRVRNLTTTKNPKPPGIAIPHHKVTVSSMQYSLLFTFLHFWFASVRFNAGSMWRGRNPSHRTPEIAYSAVSQYLVSL